MKQAKIYYAAIDDTWTKEQKLAYLEKLQHTGNVEWQQITPDKNHKGMWYSMFPLLHLQGRRNKPPGKHHRLGIINISPPLPRYHDYKMGHLLLHLCSPPSSPLPGTLRSQPQKRTSPYSLRSWLSPLCHRRKTTRRNSYQLRKTAPIPPQTSRK